MVKCQYNLYLLLACRSPHRRIATSRRSTTEQPWCMVHAEFWMQGDHGRIRRGVRSVRVLKRERMTKGLDETMEKRVMTSRERVLLALQHRETGRPPFSLGFGVNEPAKRKLMDHLGMKSLEEVDAWLYGFTDMRWAGQRYCGPTEREKVKADGAYIDYWNVVRKPVSYGEGFYDEIAHYPLGDVKEISDLDRYIWPSPDWFDAGDLYDSLLRTDREEGERAVVVGNGNILESSWYMVGFEKMLMMLADKPDLAYEIMRRVTDFFVGYFTKVLSAARGRVDIAFTADDIGQQNGLILSLPMWEELIKPHHMRLNKTIQEFGVKVMYHSDGAVSRAVPGLIDMGIDVLEALQFDATGMDPAALKENYGNRLCFHGGVSVQSTLPFGTTADVRKEVERRKRLFPKGGLFIGPTHAIQVGTPLENILEMYRAAGGLS
jgi:uroporphyrinogen decarboxylase